MLTSRLTPKGIFMKRLLVATAAFASLAASPAYAADFILGATAGVNSNFYISDNNSPISISATLGNTITTSGTYTDRYFFSPTFLASGAGVASKTGISSLIINAANSGVKSYALSTFGPALNAAFFGTGVASTLSALNTYLTSAAVIDTYSSTGTTTGIAINNVSLDLNKLYVITISGNVSGRGTYSGTLDATAVPEPATWAMMLLGFGAIGFAMRRQGRAHPKVRFAF